MNGIDILVIRYIVTLLFGINITASFADILHKKNIGKLILLTCFLLLVQGAFFLAFGLEGVLYSYPVHTHIVLVLILVIFFHCSCTKSIVYTLLAYMCCQFPTWISKCLLYSPYYTLEGEFVLYFIVVVCTSVLIMKYAGPPIHELLEGSKLTTCIIAIVPATYYLFDYYTTVWTDILYTGNYHVSQFMPTVICISYLIFAVVFRYEQKRRMEVIEDRRILENELYIVESETDNLREISELARIHRHDMRHHLALVLHLIEEDHIEEACEYIKDHIKVIDEFTPRRFCEMEMLNLILSHFAKQAEKSSTQFQCQIDLPEQIPVTKTELCALVSNALENAFHAVEALPKEKRYVDARLCEFNKKLIFSVDNTCDDKVPGTAARSGNNIERHGYGTRSIATIANEHHGMAVFQSENGRFSLMVTLPLCE